MRPPVRRVPHGPPPDHVFFLHRPSPETLRALLASRAESPFSYEKIGVTRGDHRPTLRRSHHRARLGTGAMTYAAAAAALRGWAMYRLPWVGVYPPEPALEPDTPLATVVRHLGFWSANPCRVVYRSKESGSIVAESFAIGTVSGHAERGEERFRVEWHRSDDAVWFEILSFAGPHHWLARLGTPFVRHLQRRFGVEALDAVRSDVAARLGGSRSAGESGGSV